MNDTFQANRFQLHSPDYIAVGSECDVRLTFSPVSPMRPGARLWLLYDIRQDAGRVQTDDEPGENFVDARGAGSNKLALTVHHGVSRTLDLYPQVPEFHVLTEITVGPKGLDAGETVHVTIKRWRAPIRPIRAFRFWLVADAQAEWDFLPTGFKTYRAFVRRDTQEPVPSDRPFCCLLDVSVEVRGEYPRVPAVSRRKTPGVFWGELHGMAFNQRPLDDFYNYAKNVTQLDFCAAMLFSYNTCVGNVWQEVKDAAKRHTEPGRFVAFAGFECGTPPDDSHRCACFPQPDNVPPIFCDSRPPARDRRLRARFHPDTVFCETLDEFYSAVERYGGFVCGHFHTTTYDRELLAEIWQKQAFRLDEEERIYDYMRQGKRFGLVGGSDTHDSMPGNPDPEPGCPRPAGFTGVWAEDLTPEALAEAFRARRVFATSGSRIVLSLDADGHPMGSELAAHGPRTFRISVGGTADLACVELLRDGHPVKRWRPSGSTFQAEFQDRQANPDRPQFYLLRVRQVDGHLGWSSPILFG